MANNALTKVTLLQCNYRSIRPKLNQFLHFVEKAKFSFIALSEKWLLPSDTFNLPGYHIERKDRADGYGGVMLAIRHGISYRRIRLYVVLLMWLVSSVIYHQYTVPLI